MRLSKTTADQIAKALTEHYFPRARLVQLKNDLNEFARIQAEKTVPEEVMATFKKYPGFFETDCSVRFQSPTGDWYRDAVSVELKAGLPCSASFIALPFSEKAVELEEKIKDWEADSQGLGRKIRAVLSSCTTTKQVAEAFPEAIPFIPDETTKAIVPVEAYRELRANLDALERARIIREGSSGISESDKNEWRGWVSRQPLIHGKSPAEYLEDFNDRRN